MAWDSTRPVPWQRLVRDWLLYVGIMAVVFVVIYRDDLTLGPFAGLLVSGPIFVAVGAFLAKFGYQRKTLRDLRQESDARRAAATTPTPTTAGRSKPPPTKRTAGGGGRPTTRPSSRSGKGKRR